MSPQPMPSARISMSLWSFWKSSTMAFTAARVAGLGSVSHIVTVTFFCAPAGFTPPTSEAAVAPAAVAPSRARNSRRPRAPSFRSATSRWRSALLSWRMVFLLVARRPGAGQYGSSSVTARLCHIVRARGWRRRPATNAHDGDSTFSSLPARSRLTSCCSVTRRSGRLSMKLRRSGQRPAHVACGLGEDYFHRRWSAREGERCADDVSWSQRPDSFALLAGFCASGDRDADA